eukprot:m.430214 g.430214  ORF g.430214 m.430214 type:complete len:567 (+) comp21391_c1_seq15:2124-3824(+)
MAAQGRDLHYRRSRKRYVPRSVHVPRAVHVCSDAAPLPRPLAFQHQHRSPSPISCRRVRARARSEGIRRQHHCSAVVCRSDVGHVPRVCSTGTVQRHAFEAMRGARGRVGGVRLMTAEKCDVFQAKWRAKRRKHRPIPTTASIVRRRVVTPQQVCCRPHAVKCAPKPEPVPLDLDVRSRNLKKWADIRAAVVVVKKLAVRDRRVRTGDRNSWSHALPRRAHVDTAKGRQHRHHYPPHHHADGTCVAAVVAARCHHRAVCVGVVLLQPAHDDHGQILHRPPTQRPAVGALHQRNPSCGPSRRQTSSPRLRRPLQNADIGASTREDDAVGHLQRTLVKTTAPLVAPCSCTIGVVHVCTSIFDCCKCCAVGVVCIFRRVDACFSGMRIICPSLTIGRPTHLQSIHTAHCPPPRRKQHGPPPPGRVELPLRQRALESSNVSPRNVHNIGCGWCFQQRSNRHHTFARVFGQGHREPRSTERVLHTKCISPGGYCAGQIKHRRVAGRNCCLQLQCTSASKERGQSHVCHSRLSDAEIVTSRSIESNGASYHAQRRLPRIAGRCRKCKDIGAR